MSSSTTVGEVFSKKFTSVSKEATLTQCLSLFKKGMVPVLIVLDSRGRYEGILAQRWIVRSRRLDPSKAKVERLMRKAPEVGERDSLSKAASLMIENSLRELPVFSEGKVVGVVTDEHIIHGVVLTGWGNNKIEGIMTKQLIVVDEEESIGGLLNLFKEHNISHAPVVSHGKPVGMVSIRDVIDHFFQPIDPERFGEIVGREKFEVLNATVKNIMSSPLITISPETSLKEADKKMHDSDVSSLVIVRGEKLAGIVTKRDFLEPIAQMEMKKPTLAIQFSVKELEIDETQRDFIMKDFDSFRSRFEKILELGTLFVYMKTHGTTHKGDQIVHCRLHLRTVKGSFFSSAEGWSVNETFHMGLDRIERQVLRSKELLEHNHELASEYLERINFPSTDF
nr:CBS domain-containing protein [Candidatus Freyarchaeota archaeon]